MKKLSILFILICLLMGCSNRTITTMEEEEVSQIIFAIDSHEYQIKEDKFEEIYKIFQEEYTSKEEIEGINKKHRLILKSKSEEEIFFIQKDGIIIKQEQEKYYRYTFDEDSLLKLYKKVLGNDIFYGEIALNKFYVDDYEENDVIFSISKKDVLEIVLGSYSFDQAILLKKEKIDDFINLLNQTTYYDMQEGGMLGVTPTVTLHFKDRQYWFQFQGIEHYSIISFSTKENIEKNDYQNFVCFELKNDDLQHTLLEIMGKNALSPENFKFEPSSVWVEETKGKTNKEIMCERSTLDICELE